MQKLLLLSLALLSLRPGSAQQAQTVDICVYGGTSAGVIAACAAKRAGKTVALVEPGSQVGGLTTGGLGYTDIGNKYAISGMARDFYRRVGAHYGRFESWVFEPHVALDVFKGYLDEAHVKVVYHRRLVSVEKTGKLIRAIVTEDAEKPGPASYRRIFAKQYIDCSYEGDLMAKTGVRYFVGREANDVYNETYDGAQLRDKHQFPDGIDPYRIPGDPGSGLLWGIDAAPADSPGEGDKRVQAYNFRLCLTNDTSDRIPITKPAGYNADHYLLLLRLLAKRPAGDLNAIMKIDHMPDHKTDINNNGGFSTDMIGMNYDYPDGDYATRERIWKAHESYTKGFLYFVGHDPRMPPALRREMLQWGYPKDEYTHTGHWTPQLYVRESRRMIGEYVMTQANCEGRTTVDDGIALAAYTMDSHNARRFVVNGMVKNEGDVQIGGFGPYPIAYRAIVPQKQQCVNLLVPVCLSASHIAYGSIRMEPVFMVLGQSAAIAAADAIDEHTAIQDIDIRRLRDQLRTNPLADNSTPEILVDNDDSAHVTQKGSWTRLKKGGYGPSMFVHKMGDPANPDEATDSGEATVTFRPVIVRAGTYHIYLYQPALRNASTTTSVIVNGAKLLLHPPSGEDEQQSTGEWVSVGRFLLSEGSGSSVTITSAGASGDIAADAVLFVPIPTARVHFLHQTSAIGANLP